MYHKWRWDQGRLDYFLFENIRKIALALVELDGASLQQDSLRTTLTSKTGLLFKPLNYTVLRNYKRVFECALLATRINNSLYVSDLCRDIAGNRKAMTADDFLFRHLSRFRYPFPAFSEQDRDSTVVYPFSAILKFLIYRMLPHKEVSISPQEVVSWLIGNNVTGLENDAFYVNLTQTSCNASNTELRQIREMLIFMSQLSALKWHQGRLVLDVSVSDLITLQTLQVLAEPIQAVLTLRPEEDFISLTTLGAQKNNLLIMPSRELVDDELFTEGKRTRVTHIKIERSPLLRKYFLQKNPEPVCDMCSTNTRLRYPWTKNLIEIHHLLPLSSTLSVSVAGTSLEDVVGLCPNCHRGVHSYYKKWLDEASLEDFNTPSEAKAIYSEAKSSIVL